MALRSHRYKAFKRMSGDNEKEPVARIKKIISLPLYTNMLANLVKRAHCVARIWKRADQTDLTGEASPSDYEWKETAWSLTGTQQVHSRGTLQLLLV